MWPRLQMEMDHSREARNKWATIAEPLNNLRAFINEFVTTMQLFDLCRSQLIPGGTSGAMDSRQIWGPRSFIPAKYGVFILYNYEGSLENIRAAIIDHREVNGKVDWGMFEFAKAKFKEYFPDCKKIRNAFGHQGEWPSRKHALVGPYDGPAGPLPTGIFIGCSLSGRIVGTSANGIMVHYELSESSVSKLWFVYGAVFEALCGKDDPRNHEERAQYSCLKLRAGEMPYKKNYPDQAP